MNKLILTTTLATFISLGWAEIGSDTYVYMTFGSPQTLDPEATYDTASDEIIENVYETLYTYKGESITEYEPLLATSYEVSEDGLTYTYTLREGVKFHSGNDFSCKDVEYSIERILVINDSESGVWFHAEALLGNDGSNANDDPNITWEMIDGSVECLDEYTVQFNLPKVDPAFFVKLLYKNASVIDSQWATENGEWGGTEDTWRDWVGIDPRVNSYLHNNVSGTGAYKLISWDGSDVIAERFDDYWGEAASIKNIQILSVAELSSRLLALQNGDADRIVLGSNIDWATLENQVSGLEGIKIHEDPSWASLAVGGVHLVQEVITEDNEINVGSGELDGKGVPSDFFADLDVRLGFAYSFDLEEFAEAMFLGNGVILTMALPPSFLGYDPEVPIYPYDSEKAEEHFKKAFNGELWEKGFEITISYNTGNETRKTIAEIFKANIEDLNSKFKVNVRGIDWPEFLTERHNNKLPVNIVSWGADYADPDNFIHVFYHSQGYYGQQIGFQDADIDSYVEQARSTSDLEERASLYSATAHRAYELAPIIVYPTARVFMVTRDNIKGVYYNPMVSHFYLWKNISKSQVLE